MPMQLSPELLKRRELTEMKRLIAAGENEQALVLYDCSENITADLCRYAVVAAREANMKWGYLLGVQLAAQKLPNYAHVKADIIRDLALYHAERGNRRQAHELLFSVPFEQMTTEQLLLWDIAHAKTLLYQRRYKKALLILTRLSKNIPHMTDRQVIDDLDWWLFVVTIVNFKFKDGAEMARFALELGHDKKPKRLRLWRWASSRWLGPLRARLAIAAKLKL